MAAGGSARLVREKEEEEKRNTVAGKDKGERGTTVEDGRHVSGSAGGDACRGARRGKNRERERERLTSGAWWDFYFLFPFFFLGCDRSGHRAVRYGRHDGVSDCPT